MGVNTIRIWGPDANTPLLLDTAARHGIKTVDIGVAILSMHSVRELCGADDPHLLANALVAFLQG
jgi:aspartyl aminopeptidase